MRLSYTSTVVRDQLRSQRLPGPQPAGALGMPVPPYI